jgi:hypothetical protein
LAVENSAPTSFLAPNRKVQHIKMSIKKQAENGRKAGGNQAVLNSIGISGYSVGTVGNTAESELRGGFFSQVSVKRVTTMKMTVMRAVAT